MLYFAPMPKVPLQTCNGENGIRKPIEKTKSLRKVFFIKELSNMPKFVLPVAFLKHLNREP